jgi:hypothetical protein
MQTSKFGMLKLMRCWRLEIVLGGVGGFIKDLDALTYGPNACSRTYRSKIASTALIAVARAAILMLRNWICSSGAHQRHRYSLPYESASTKM